ncbi:methylmalonyl Co-A mutase-associated GTPase MeaB [Metabacillus sp. RGM 3146]|uniref:methylmalonyl Co-A mutase-associated GTPase MeaB n=1 Tax=Metabacillus sp. RGM 3146 TaxID=3401092 RepID=UPI003B990EC5
MIRKKRKAGFDGPSPEEYAEGVLEGNRVMLSKAITLIESNAPQHFDAAQSLIQKITPERKPSLRIGITGVPGAGKSTFIDAFGSLLCDKGHKVAILAVDPSSQVSKGSILGDKTRMERMARNPRGFVRPSPSSGVLGGVNRKTRETILLCEAAGYDIILVETVGVGQGEFMVRGMVDFFLLLVLTGAGDELQTMKKGIMELPDLVVVNKADGENVAQAKKAMQEYNTILHFLKPYTEGWTTEAVTASALKEQGISEIWGIIEKFKEITLGSGGFEERRMEQQKDWFYESIKEQLMFRFFNSKGIKEKIRAFEEDLKKEKVAVAANVQSLLDEFFSKN